MGFMTIYPNSNLIVNRAQNQIPDPKFSDQTLFDNPGNGYPSTSLGHQVPIQTNRNRIYRKPKPKKCKTQELILVSQVVYH